MANNNNEIDLVAIATNTVFNINMSNVTKLTGTNYMMWSLQVHALLDGYGLAGHLDGSTAAPSATVTVANVVTENPAFVRWQRQNKLIYSGLIGAISVTVQPTVSHTTTASQIWDKLAATYAKPSRGHIKQLKTQVTNYTKGTKTIDEYMQGIITKLDQLAILGKPYDHEDQVELILAGLPDDYKPVVDQIEGKDNPPSLTEVHERLLNHEAKLISASDKLPLAFPASANVAQHRQQSGYNKGGYNNNKKPYNSSYGSSSTYQSQQSVNTQDNRTYKPYLGKCQICNTQGHSTRRCPQYQPHATPMTQQQNSPFHPWQPRANLAAGPSYDPSQWLLDSGATHHMTSDLHNLSLHEPYNGGEDVVVANGSPLAITHTGEGSQHGGSTTTRQN